MSYDISREGILNNIFFFEKKSNFKQGDDNTMNEITNVEQNQENIDIENMIYEIRGKQVMLDSDLGATG